MTALFKTFVVTRCDAGGGLTNRLPTLAPRSLYELQCQYSNIFGEISNKFAENEPKPQHVAMRGKTLQTHTELHRTSVEFTKLALHKSLKGSAIH